MSATLGMKNVKVKAFGTYTTVPNNAIAKLMYYLDCVATVIDYDDRTLTDYQNYDELSGEELVAVYALAKKLNPSLFLKAGIFIIDEKLLFNNLANQFFEITDETIGFHANQEIVIGGRVVKVLKVMACNNNWLSAYYYRPIAEIDNLVREIENRNYRSQIVTTQTSIIEEKPVIIVQPNFGSNPVSMTCPHCKTLITTQTDPKLNFLACCCCLLFSIYYFCFQLCVGKNPCCCDVIHRCPKCGMILGEYDSC